MQLFSYTGEATHFSANPGQKKHSHADNATFLYLGEARNQNAKIGLTFYANPAKARSHANNANLVFALVSTCKSNKKKTCQHLKIVR